MGVRWSSPAVSTVWELIGNMRNQESIRPISDPRPLESRALNNDLVLEAIFENLSPQTLLDCRLVCKKWDQVGSDILKRQRLACITISSWTDESFNELHEILSKRSEHFLPTALRITERSLEASDPFVRRFFADFGPMFTRLDLNYFVPPDESDIVHLLQDYLPNIEELFVGLPTLTALEHRLKVKVPQFRLPHVQRIQFQVDESCPNFHRRGRQQLIRGAENLGLIDGVYSCDLEDLQRQNRIGTVRSLTMEYFQCTEDVGLYKSLEKRPPASLNELALRNPLVEQTVSTEFLQCVNALLIASNDTLKTLTLHGITMEWERFPVQFPKLRQMNLGFRETRQRFLNYGRVIVSPGFENVGPSKTFPSLKHLCLILPLVWVPEGDFGDDRAPMSVSTKILQQYFWKEGAAAWNSVDTIEFHNHVTPNGMSYLAQVFPNVTQVIVNFSYPYFPFSNKFGSRERDPSDLWYVSKFQLLRKLVLRDFPVGNADFLDPLLTGIPGSICQNLVNMPKQDFEGAVEEILRPHGGLWKLRTTGIRELNISYKMGGLIDDDENPFMTMVSVWYGLQVIPGLRTTLKIPHEAKAECRDALQLLRPYVDIEYYRELSDDY